MQKPIFFICSEKDCILSLITGEKEQLKQALGEHFTILDPAKSEGAGEKHLPIVTQSESTVTVTVGSILHPMTDEHSINWIYLETTLGGQLKFLPSTGEPAATFCLTPEDKAVAAYAYCNLHGFWKADIS